MSGRGLLVVMTDIPSEFEGEFNRWNDEAHMADMLAYPGVLSARRYRIVEGRPTYQAMFDLDDPDVVNQPGYQEYVFGSNPGARPLPIAISSAYFNTIRGVYRELLSMASCQPTDLSRGRSLLLRGLSVDPEHDQEFDEWHTTEHIPNLSRVPGVLRARRFKLNAKALRLRGEPPAYMAVYELETREVLESNEWRRAAATPWTDRVKRFFREPSLRNVYERIFPA